MRQVQSSIGTNTTKYITISKFQKSPNNIPLIVHCECLPLLVHHLESYLSDGNNGHQNAAMDQCLKQMLCHNRTVVAIVLLNPFSIFGSLSLSVCVCCVCIPFSSRHFQFTAYAQDKAFPTQTQTKSNHNRDNSLILATLSFSISSTNVIHMFDIILDSASS